MNSQSDDLIQNKKKGLCTSMTAISVVVLALISLIQCIVQRHTVGIVISFLAIAMSLLQITLLHKVLPKLLRLSLTLLFIFLAGQVALFLLVKLVSAAPVIISFPGECTKKMACARVADTDPWRAPHIAVPQIASTSGTVAESIRKWLH